MCDKINVCILDDQGFCYKDQGLLIPGINPAESNFSYEFSQYFCTQWMRSVKEPQTWVCLVSKTLATDAKTLNKRLPDILCIDYALKARLDPNRDYEFSPPVETYLKMNCANPNLLETRLKNDSPLPGLREAAKEAGIDQTFVENTEFGKDYKEYGPPEDADYTARKDTSALKKGAVDSMGALAGRLMHLLISNLYGTICIGLTAHNVNDFKQTELAFAEYILGESRENATFLCTEPLGDQFDKMDRDAFKKMVKNGVQALRKRLVELSGSSVEFNLFELEDLLRLGVNSENLERYDQDYEKYIDACRKKKPKLSEPKLPEPQSNATLPVDKAITVKTAIGERRLPLNGLFIDIALDERVAEMHKWVGELKAAIFKRRRFTWLAIQRGKNLAKKLFNCYEEKMELRAQRRDLSKLLMQTFEYWQQGKNALPDNVREYFKKENTPRLTEDNLAYYCNQSIQSRKGKKSKAVKDKLLKNYNATFTNTPNAPLDCVTECCYITQEKDETVQRWTIFFVYAHLCCEYQFTDLLEKKLTEKISARLEKKNTDGSKAAQPMIEEKDIADLPKSIKTSARCDFGERVLYDALYPLPKTPLILPFQTKDSPSKSWRLPVGVKELVQNGLAKDDGNVFEKGELTVVQDYAADVWKELKAEYSKRLKSGK